MAARVGWVGVGVMGKHMCAHLMKAGHRATVYSRTAAKCAPLVEQGATLAASPREVAEASDVVFTIVSNPSDVESVVLDPQSGVLGGMRPGGTLIDMTTSTPSLAIRIDEAARALDIRSLDAPVSGGDVGAQAGTLSIMCGGERATFDAVQPLLACMGKNIQLMGGAGSGQHTKMCNQVLVCTTMIGVCESMLYAQRAGLDPLAVVGAIGSGAAGSWAINNLGPKVVAADYAPGFMIEHFVKDLGIALSEASAMGLRLPGLELAHRLYASLLEQGHGKDGTQALVLAIQAAAAEASK